MSRLNYNKWDTLELSDDSDIEVHPNVDKKSMIRWKQRDIHEKREVRKLKQQHLVLELAMNQSLLNRMQQLIDGTDSDGLPFISKTMEQLRIAVPDFQGKQFKEGEQPSEDHMVLALLSQVLAKVGPKLEGDEGKKKIVDELMVHKKRLEDRQVDVKKEQIELDKEAAKYITSDDLHVGFESKTMISSNPSTAQKVAPVAPSPAPAPSNKGKAKETVTSIETLNSPGVQAAQLDDDFGNDSGDEEEDAAPLTELARRFSLIPVGNFEMAFKAISSEPSLLSEANTDALLVEAFSVGMKGGLANEARARQLVEKGLILQYCMRLGKDGVALFFKRMTSHDNKALNMFLEDVATTAKRIIDRSRVVAAERAAERDAGGEGVEQIQLVASGGNQVITFEIPDGPSPDKLEITGEGSENFDVEAVKAFLQKRWDIFQGFPKNLQKALGEKSLEKVNKVLGKMSVEEAEEVVGLLQEAGILSFETNEIIDQTGAEGSSGGEQIKVPVSVTAPQMESVEGEVVDRTNYADELD